MNKTTTLEKVTSQLRREEAAWLQQSRMRLRRAAERRLAERKVTVR